MSYKANSSNMNRLNMLFFVENELSIREYKTGSGVRTYNERRGRLNVKVGKYKPLDIFLRHKTLYTIWDEDWRLTSGTISSEISFMVFCWQCLSIFTSRPAISNFLRSKGAWLERVLEMTFGLRRSTSCTSIG